MDNIVNNVVKEYFLSPQDPKKSLVNKSPLTTRRIKDKMDNDIYENNVKSGFISDEPLGAHLSSCSGIPSSSPHPENQYLQLIRDWSSVWSLSRDYQLQCSSCTSLATSVASLDLQAHLYDAAWRSNDSSRHSLFSQEWIWQYLPICYQVYGGFLSIFALRQHPMRLSWCRDEAGCATAPGIACRFVQEIDGI